MVGGQVGASDPTNQAYLRRVEALVDELGIGDCVEWTGFTANEEVSANLLATDCAVLPYREGATLRHGSLMAALAHGLPIVSTHTPPEQHDTDGIFPAIVHEDNALLVAPEDPEALAAAVTRLMTSHALRARLAGAAQALSQEFQWDAIAGRHLELYRRLGAT
jgi:glycosyltransferase involved in cell wall biosynthesis